MRYIMKFYRIDTSDKFMNKKYAYLSVNSKNEIKDKEKVIEIEHILCHCPFCGFKYVNIFYPEKNYGIFNKDSVGDFSFGVTSYGAFGLSAKAVDLIKKYNLKGIIDFKKYISIETTRKDPITSIDNEYYEAKIAYLPLIWEHVIDENNESKSFSKVDHIGKYGCEKCISNKIYESLNKADKLYIKELNEVSLDIFSTTDNRGKIIVSQRFVDMCEKEGLTNIVKKFIEIYDSKDYDQIK